jgi:hypothetical protein
MVQKKRSEYMMHVYSPNQYRCLILRCATIGSTDRLKEYSVRLRDIIHIGVQGNTVKSVTVLYFRSMSQSPTERKEKVYIPSHSLIFSLFLLPYIYIVYIPFTILSSITRQIRSFSSTQSKMVASHFTLSNGSKIPSIGLGTVSPPLII